jgi:hypothetical protein
LNLSGLEGFCWPYFNNFFLEAGFIIEIAMSLFHCQC